MLRYRSRVPVVFIERPVIYEIVAPRSGADRNARELLTMPISRNEKRAENRQARSQHRRRCRCRSRWCSSELQRTDNAEQVPRDKMEWIGALRLAKCWKMILYRSLALANFLSFYLSFFYFSRVLRVFYSTTNLILIEKIIIWIHVWNWINVEKLYSINERLVIIEIMFLEVLLSENFPTLQI